MFYKIRMADLPALILLVFSLSTGSLYAQQTEAYWYDGSWPHEHNDLVPDKNAHFSKLDNGFRYVIIPNNYPPGRVSLYLNVQVGSLMEEANELGFAHFVEHMAFNGSKKFPAGTLIPFFQQNGMSFGGDTNAHTSWAETVYKLDLATSSLKTISTGLDILGDFAAGQLMLEDEVSDEIGVILSEKTARDSENAQAAKKRREALYSGTLFVNDVIGTDETIKSASKAGLTKFYQKWYHPKRMILVIVGDVKPEEVSPLVAKQFSSLNGKQAMPTVGSWGEPKTDGVSVFYDSRPISSTNISIQINHPRQHFRDSRDMQKKVLIDSLLQIALQQRLDTLNQNDPDLWNKARFSLNRYNGFLPAVGFSAVTDANGWQTTLGALVKEMRTASAYGFSDDEVNRAKQQLSQYLERRVKDRNSMPSAKIASEFIAVTNSDRVYTSAEDDLSYFRSIEQQLKPQDINQALKEALAPDNQTVYISGNAKIASTDEILAVLEAGKRMAIVPYNQSALTEFPYLPLPDENIALPELKTRSLGQDAPTLYSATLANNVEIYLLPTSYEKNQVIASLLFGDGSLSLSEQQIPVMRLAGSVLNEGGVGALSKIESNLLFNSKGISIQEGYSDRAAFISGSGQSKDVNLMLEAMWTQYQDPVALESARKKTIQRMALQRSQRDNTVDGVEKAESASFFYGDSKRFATLSESDAEKISLDEIKRFITSTRQHGPVRLIVSGDFQVDEVLPVINRLFASQPVKTAERVTTTVKPVFPAGKTQTRQVNDNVSKAVIQVAYQSNLDNINNQDLLVTRQLMAAVLRDRMRLELREKRGIAYSASAAYQTSAENGGFGLLSLKVPTDKTQLTDAQDGITALLDTLMIEGLTENELTRLRMPMRTSWTTARKRTALWHRLVQHELLTGQPYVQWNNEFIDRLEKINAEQVLAELQSITQSAPKATLIIQTADK